MKKTAFVLLLALCSLVGFVGAQNPPGGYGPGNGTSFPVLAPNGSNGAPSYSFANAPATGLYYNGVNSIELVNAGTIIFGVVAGVPQVPGAFQVTGAITVGNGSSFGTGTSFGSGTTLTTIGTVTNCNSSASPAVCGSAPAGSVTIAAAATTVQVNTTAVTANSQIIIIEDDSLGVRLSVTCNTTSLGATKVSARTAGSNFTITTASAPATNPACLSYQIIN